jgi:trk system potassium uptake protein TrkA
MKQYAVIGLGRFGSSVAKTLASKGQQVLAIDSVEDSVQDLAEYVTNAVCIDATDEKALKNVGIQSVDVAIVAIGKSLEASILVTLALKELGVGKIIAKAVSENQGKVLEKLGVNLVVFPERDMGEKLANKLISPEVVEEINLSPEYSLFEITTPQEFIGKSLKELEIRAKHSINIIAIKRKVKPAGRKAVGKLPEILNILPKGDDILMEQDVFLILGTYEAIEKMKKEGLIPKS